VLILVLGLALMWSRRRAHEWSGHLTRRRAVLCLLLLLLSLGLLSTQRPNPFLYFQF
jgi:hypothetical protein